MICSCSLTPYNAPAAGYTWVNDIYLSFDSEYVSFLNILYLITEESYRLGEVADRQKPGVRYGLYAPLQKPHGQKSP
jgi:hypothetical protein